MGARLSRLLRPDGCWLTSLLKVLLAATAVDVDPALCAQAEQKLGVLRQPQEALGAVSLHLLKKCTSPTILGKVELLLSALVHLRPC